MLEIEFIHDDVKSIIKCQENENINNIYEKLTKKMLIKPDSLNFIYNNEKISDNLSIKQIIKNEDKYSNKMKIIVNKINSEKIQKSKRNLIICPQCGKSINIKFKDYKISLFDCKNGHKFDEILLEEFPNNQKIKKESNLKCKNCKDKNNIKKTYYRCYQCQKYLCQDCYSIHNQTHNITFYDKMDYVCSIHGEKLCSFCKTCKLNICSLCLKGHKNHDVVYFNDIIPSKELIIKNKTRLKETIDLFNTNIKEIINILNKVIQNIEQYYKIYNSIINNIENNEINYEILNNLKEVLNNNSIQKDIDIINNQNNIKHKFNNIIKIYKEMSKKNFEEENDITIIYNVKENERIIKLFDSTFVENNKKYCKINYRDKEYDLSSTFNISDIHKNLYDNKFEIKLKNIKKIKSMSHMFYNCSSLESLPDINKCITSSIKDMSFLFFGCSSLTYLPGISSWDTSNVEDMQGMFGFCSSLKELPDISNWNISKVKKLNKIFFGCSSLKSLPDISKWDTKNVIDMHCMFSGCSSLKFLPDISKLNTSKVIDMNCMFFNCSNLYFIPDISKWDTSSAENMSWMFSGCISLYFFPDISKWNIKNVKNFNCMFYGCNSLAYFPDISRWNYLKILDMNLMFSGCPNELNIPDELKI